MIETKLKKEFEKIVSDMLKGKGLDEMSSRLFSVLYVNNEKMTMEELSNETGYSMSAICTGMKFLENTGFVTKTKKPKSKQIFFFMEKDLLSKMNEIQKKQYENAILPAKNKLPGIIKEIQKNKTTKKEDLDIVKDFYEQILMFEEINLSVEKKINELIIKRKNIKR